MNQFYLLFIFLITYRCIHDKIKTLEGDEMKVYNDLDYSYIVEQIIMECIQKTKENPLQQYTFIVDHPAFFEEAFFKHTHALFSIEIMTLESHLKKQVLTYGIKANKITNMEKVIRLYTLINSNKTLFSNTPIYSMIEQLLPIFDELSLTDIDKINCSNQTLLSKEKIDTCMQLYTQYIEQLPPNTYPTLVDALLNQTISSEDTTYIFVTNKIMHPKYITYLKQLDAIQEITVVVDTATTMYTLYFNNLISNDMTRHTPLIDSIYTSLLTDTPMVYKDTHPFYYTVETTPLHEVQAIVLDIYQQIINTKASYCDFAIYYPNPTYRDLLEQVLTSFTIPFNGAMQSNEILEMKACQLLLQYALYQEEETFILLLDTLVLKSFTDFKTVNYLKKQWQEFHAINQDTYTVYLQHIMDSYCHPLLHAKSFSQFSSILKTFVLEEIVFSDLCTTVINYLTTIEAYLEETSLKEYLSFIEYTKPIDSINGTALIDHVYLFNTKQVYSGLLHIDTIYIVGCNESILPPSYKDEGILLDSERQKMYGLLTLQDTVTMFNHTMFKILTSNDNKIIFSYALMSANGETVLPSSLLLQLQETYSMPVVETLPFYLVYPSHLYLDGGSDTSLKIDPIINLYKQSKNQPAFLCKPIVQETLSASQLETYNGCPYKYFHQYSMKLKPFDHYLLQPNEIGTFVHYLIESNSHLFVNQEVANKTNIHDLPQTIHTQIEEYIQNNSSLKMKCIHAMNRYFIECMEKDIYTTICILINQMKVSLFSLTKTEEKISSTYSSFNMKGFVDRFDTFRNFLLVIDYKSSDKELDLNLAMQGFNMQMLIYMDMLAKNKNLDKGAILYFNTKKRIIKSKDSILDTIDDTEFFKLYRMNGYVHRDVIEEIDNQIDGSSAVIKARFVKSKGEYSGNILDTDTFNRLLTKIEEHIQLLYTHMIRGDIEIRPKGSYDPSIHSKVNPCTYCCYRSLCHLDIFYNENSIIENLNVACILGGGQDE